MRLIPAGQTAPKSISRSTPASTVGLGARAWLRPPVSCKYSYHQLACGAERNQPCHLRAWRSSLVRPAGTVRAGHSPNVRGRARGGGLPRRRPLWSAGSRCRTSVHFRQRGTRQRMNDAKMRRHGASILGKELAQLFGCPDLRRRPVDVLNPRNPCRSRGTCDAAPAPARFRGVADTDSHDRMDRPTTG